MQGSGLGLAIASELAGRMAGRLYVHSRHGETTFTLELKEFFESYKRLENKVVTVPDFQGKETAMKIIEKAMGYYQLKIKYNPQA